MVERGFNWHAFVGISGDWISQRFLGTFAYGKDFPNSWIRVYFPVLLRYTAIRAA